VLSGYAVPSVFFFAREFLVLMDGFFQFSWREVSKAAFAPEVRTQAVALNVSHTFATLSNDFSPYFRRETRQRAANSCPVGQCNGSVSPLKASPRSTSAHDAGLWLLFILAYYPPPIL